jgi:hypothetical protein
MAAYVFCPHRKIISRAFRISGTLKGHGNEADFLGFLQKLVLIDSLHYLSSRSKLAPRLGELGSRRLSDSASRGVALVSPGVTKNFF